MGRRRDGAFVPLILQVRQSNKIFPRIPLLRHSLSLFVDLRCGFASLLLEPFTLLSTSPLSRPPSPAEHPSSSRSLLSPEARTDLEVNSAVETKQLPSNDQNRTKKKLLKIHKPIQFKPLEIGLDC
ncbi:hypothetical protein PIB30_087193 [Stylosanthes scabra]|uniref:Uncharacterized protein n=1 Tax=Stylosanthes scabra TaxID=79078 RepID=A0ABU6WRQ0_9FABA|nr:hypothetical protein [Stylosanthes scabra]